MKEFDFIIIGGGCAGLSLAYELEINDKLKDKTLAIIETFLSIFDLIKLSLISKNDDNINHDHNLINEEINLNERI